VAHLPVTLANSGYHCLALKSDGTIAAWGCDGFGQAAVPTGLSNVIRVASLPAVGALYQYTNGVRGPVIAAPNLAVTDASGRIIFAPAINGIGSPHATLSFVASDGGSDSSPATVTVNVLLPSPPQLSSWQLTSNRLFELYFIGGSNGRYRVWASTNLLTWEPLGLPEETTAGSFRFLDFSATN
jgi:hypothetical protein